MAATPSVVEPPFALGRFRAGNAPPFLGLVIGSAVARVDRFLPGAERLGDLLTEWDSNVALLAEAADALRGDSDPARLEVAQIDRLSVLAPVEPRQIFQSGANYRTHVVDLIVARAREQGDADLDAVRQHAEEAMESRALHDQPYVFIGLPSALCGPYDDVQLPDTGAQHDWELELAAVIGAETYRVARDETLSRVAGYLIVNDLTTRDRVYRPDMPGIGSDWLASKNAPTFLPAGPFVVPAAFVEDPQQLQITLRVNGETMQDESSSGMIFDVERLVEYTSTVAKMWPGDLLLTGSPRGNGAHHGRYLAEGDVIEGTITGLGTQRNRCVLAAKR